MINMIVVLSQIPYYKIYFHSVSTELMDTPTFKRFNAALDAVFENSEDMEVTVDTGKFHFFSLLDEE